MSKSNKQHVSLFLPKVVRTNTTVKIREIAFQVYLNRQITGKAGDAISDWSTAQRIYNSPIHRLRFQLNWLLIHTDQRASAPLVRWVFNTSTFQIFERLSPVLEAIGVLAIPFLVFAVTQSSQDKMIARERDYQQTLRQQDTERLQQQAVKDYFGQLTTLLLSLEGSLQSPENKRLRLLAEATTLALLDEPEFTQERKEQVIRFLSRMELVNEQTPSETSPSDEKIGAILSLSGANLADTNLSGMTLRRANLRKASLRKAVLYKTNLSKADLSEADLGGAVLAETDLSEANLTNVNFSGDIAVSYDIDDTGTVVRGWQ